MAGILNSKERVMDVIVTDEGKRQAANGEFNIRFASFSDRGSFYESSGNDNIASDASGRLYFEAVSLLDDRIIIETEDVYDLNGAPSGRRLPFRGTDFQVSGRSIITGSLSSIASRLPAIKDDPNSYNSGTYEVSGSAVDNALTDKILRTITDHFQNQMIIADRDPFSEGQGFDVSVSDNEFIVSHYSPHYLLEGSTHGRTCNVDVVESFFQDRKLAHLPNFTYLPPVNERIPGEKNPRQLASYINASQNNILSFEELESTLKNKPFIDVNFVNTSRDNNVIAQVFEFSPDSSNESIKKLSIIDFGEFVDDDPNSPGKHVFFVGKVIRDTSGVMTFINIFTVVFD